MLKEIPLIPTDPERLALFLGQDEGAALEFKREWYKLEGDPKSANRQKDELVKDILALANGNPEVVGDASFLVIGVEDHREADGSRRVHDLGDSIPSPSQILDIIRSAASPPLGHIEILPFKVDQARLFAVVIPPSPHIHETTRRLHTPTQAYSKYVVFIRKGGAVDVASEGEREVLRKLKKALIADATNPPATIFGAMVGATIGGVLLSRVGSKITGSKEGTIAGAIVGPIFGGLFGALFGQSYNLLIEAQKEFRRATPSRRRFAIVASAPFVVFTWLVSDKFGDFITKRLQGSISRDLGA